MPELTAHVSLRSNRLQPNSMLLTPLPGYEPKSNQMDIGRPRDQLHGHDLERDYDRDSLWVGIMRGTTPGTGREMEGGSAYIRRMPADRPGDRVGSGLGRRQI